MQAAWWAAFAGDSPRVGGIGEDAALTGRRGGTAGEGCEKLFVIADNTIHAVKSKEISLESINGIESILNSFYLPFAKKD